MAIQYFFKELISNEITIDGNKVPWEPLSGDSGVLQVDGDSDLAKALTSIVGTLGVRTLSSVAEYEVLKKKRDPINSPKRNDSPFSVVGSPQRPRVAAPEAVAAQAVAKADPAPVASAPRLGKLKMIPLST